MAKARKQKPEGGAGGGATVLHQKLCLSIDMENQLIYGYTEMKVLLAENDTFALHADSMTIRNILVDGEAAEFEYSPHWKNVDDQPNWSSVSCLKTAADAACSAYVSSLTSEALPNLIISSERSVKSTTELPGGENGEKHEENGGKPVHFSDDKAVKLCNGSAEGNGKEEEKENRKEDEKENGKEEKTEIEMEPEVKGREKDKGKETKEEREKDKGKETDEEKEKENEEENEVIHENEKDKESEMQIEDEKVKNTKLVRVDYILEKAETGVHFVNNVLHSNSQIRRAHCWFPCIDSATQRCPFDLEFTVSTDLVAVSNGDLLYQVLSKEDPPRKTYVYKLNTPVSAQWISLVVGPFEVLPDKNGISVSHMCLSPTLSKLENTISFFHDVYSCYEDYLAAPFPFGLYKQIFLPSEMVVSPSSFGASTCIFSADILNDEKVIDQVYACVLSAFSPVISVRNRQVVFHGAKGHNINIHVQGGKYAGTPLSTNIRNTPIYKYALISLTISTNNVTIS